MPAPHLTQRILKRFLEYDPETGHFVWKSRGVARWDTAHAGMRAGHIWLSKDKYPYRVIKLLGWPFKEHRLAWLYMSGRWPTNLIDHRDCDGTNNKWKNLREASLTDNCANKKISSINKSGFKGVTLTPGGRFRATIRRDGKQRHIGTYETAEEANAAYYAAALTLHGDFARSE